MQQKKTRVMKALYMMVLVLALGIALSGCSAGKLAEEFDEGAVIAKAEQGIQCCNQEDFAGLTATMNAAMRSVTTEELFSTTIMPIIKEKGAFQSFGETSVDGKHDKDTDTDFAVITVLAKYEQGNILYTVSVDKNLKIAGFYLK